MLEPSFRAPHAWGAASLKVPFFQQMLLKPGTDVEISPAETQARAEDVTPSTSKVELLKSAGRSQ